MQLQYKVQVHSMQIYSMIKICVIEITNAMNNQA